MRAIPVALTTTFIAKARGRITGTAEIKAEDLKTEGEISVVSNMYDQRNTLVATVVVTWKVSQRNPKTMTKAD